MYFEVTITTTTKFVNSEMFCYFSFFLYDDLIQLIIDERKPRHSEKSKWTIEFDKTRIACLFGVMLISGYGKSTIKSMYWATEDVPKILSYIIPTCNA